MSFEKLFDFIVFQCMFLPTKFQRTNAWGTATIHLGILSYFQCRLVIQWKVLNRPRVLDLMTLNLSKNLLSLPWHKSHQKVQYFDNIQIASLKQKVLVFAKCAAIAEHSERFRTPCAFPSKPCCIWVLSYFLISSLCSECSCKRNFNELMHEVP